MANSKWITLVLGIVMLASFAGADPGHNHSAIDQGEAIVNADISCTALDDEQREAVGEYFMGQLHPGAAHKLMDQLLLSNGQEHAKETHISLADALYCINESSHITVTDKLLSAVSDVYAQIISTTYWPFHVLWGGLSLLALIMAIFWFSGMSFNTPERILTRRFAKGDITERQYVHALTILPKRESSKEQKGNRGSHAGKGGRQ